MTTHTHTLVAEQMKKFIDAVGGICESEIAGGDYTTAQLLEMAKSRGGLFDWPKTTDDPRVNYAVDCVDELDTFNEEEPEYDEQLYADEIEAFRENGAFA